MSNNETLGGVEENKEKLKNTEQYELKPTSLCEFEMTHACVTCKADKHINCRKVLCERTDD